MIRLAIVEDEDGFALQLSNNIERYSAESGTELQVTRYWDCLLYTSDAADEL